MELVSYKDIHLQKEIMFIDVRTPAEFEKGHIPDSFNLPLFSNEERAVVGTIYKQQSPDLALKKGLDFVGPKMSHMVSKTQKLAQGRAIVIYCWRGGARSESVAWLLSMSGLTVKKLEGGYKAYRKFIRTQFNQQANIIMLSGKTGCGKTRLLHLLDKNGEQIIDLEGLANHMGSAFGYRGTNLQPSNEQFENNLYHQWKELDLQKPLYIEDESQNIGAVSIVDELFNQIKVAPTIFIEIEIERRVENILEDYKDIDTKYLIKSCDRIKKRFGGLRYKQAIELINEQRYSEAVKLILEYYDHWYEKTISKYRRKTIRVDLSSMSLAQQMDKIISLESELIEKM